MYRMNPYNRSTPRDRLDPRMHDLISGGYNHQKSNGCRCGDAENRMHAETRSACSSCELTPYARNDGENNCGCNDADDHYNAEYNYALAMVYSPTQEFQNLFCEEEGLKAGTIFRELDKPFYGPKCHGGHHHE